MRAIVTLEPAQVKFAGSRVLRAHVQHERDERSEQQAEHEEKKWGDRRGLNPRQLEPQTAHDETVGVIEAFIDARADVRTPPQPSQPLPAAASLDDELRVLVSELRAVVADLRADNRRLREQLGERTANVTEFAPRRSR